MNKSLIHQLCKIAQNYPEIHSIRLFGSRAYGDHNELSDIDLAIVAPKLTKMHWLLLTEQIESELDTLLKIDLVWYDNVSESLQKEIDRRNTILYNCAS